MALSALVAAMPLVVVLILMGGLRKSGLFASACGLVAAGALAVLVWRMPPALALWSVADGFCYALWPVMWLVFAGLWLYNLCVDAGTFEMLRGWMAQHASGDACIQAILVAFCFGALLESCAGFGAPVAVTAALLVGLGFGARRAVAVALIANTAPVAFGGMGLPIIVLAGVTELDLAKLSAMVGRQLPLLSLILPAYLVWVVAGGQGLRRTWPAAVVAGGSFALTQFAVSNLWGPYAADIVAASVSIAALMALLRIWAPSAAYKATPDDQASTPTVGRDRPGSPLALSASFVAWLPWTLLSIVVLLWSYLKLFQKGQLTIQVPSLHNGILITLYHRPYSALYSFQPLAVGTAVFVAAVLTAFCLRVRPRTFQQAAIRTLRQLRLPGFTVILIVGLAYLYNYSGMAFTLGAAVAQAGWVFPLVSSYLGWVACSLSGSDAASNLLFGNLQVAAAHQLHLNPVLLAATNSSGAVAGKMISPQNIAVGVTTVDLIGQEGGVLRSTFWHSIAFAGLLGLLALAQAYWAAWMVP